MEKERLSTKRIITRVTELPEYNIVTSLKTSGTIVLQKMKPFNNVTIQVTLRINFMRISEMQNLVPSIV